MVTATGQPPVAADERALVRVAVAFGLGEVTDLEVIVEGLMNRNWRVDTAGGQVAVKQIRDVDFTTARRQHAVVNALARRGLPVPVPLWTATNDSVVEVDGEGYAATLWIDGRHRAGVEFTVAEAADLGRLLAELHVGLAAVLPALPATVRVSVAEPARTKDGIDRYAALINDRSKRDSMDRYVAGQLHERRELLERVAHLRPADDVTVAPAGWTHGDFQHLNLLYRNGRVAAVLDWDRLAVRPLASEVVRSATLLFGHGDDRGLDLGRVTAFTTGYRTARPLPEVAVIDAVHRQWWDRVCDLWQLRRRYEHADTSCDHLFLSASSLLWWWTARREAVTEAFTATA